MRRLLSVIAVLCSLMTFGQSEYKGDYVTKNIVVSEKANGEGPFTWQVRITYHQGDPTKRITLWNHNGAGEIGTDTTFFTYPSIHSFGPHYFLSNGSGWDGGLTLGSGTIYPNYITIQPPAVNMRPWHVAAVMDSIIKYYPIDSTAMGFMGLSMGSQEWQYIMMYYPTPGDEHYMARMRCFVDLQGEGGEQFSPYITGPGYPTALGHWAKRYGGKMFGVEGTQDTRNIWQLTQNMRDSTGGKTQFFAFDNLNGGSGPGKHCCWNSMYDPTVNDWTDSPSTKLGQSWIVYSTNPQTTMGNYVRDAVRGTNIFQWMLKQMPDTSLRVNGTFYNQPAAKRFWSPGEYNTGFIKDGIGYSVTSNPALNGAGGSGVAGTAVPITVPAGTLFTMASPILHGQAFLSTTGRVYTFGGNDSGTCAIGSNAANITTATAVMNDSSGTDMGTVSLVQGSYAANSAEGLYFVIHGASSDTLKMSGNTRYGMRGDGTMGGINRLAVTVFPCPAGIRILQIASSKYTVILLSNGTIRTAGGSFSAGNPPNYSMLGYIPTTSATDYLTWHQVTGFDAGDSIRQIAGGDVGGTILLGKSGTLYYFGLHASYAGSNVDSNVRTPMKITTNVTSFIPGGIKQGANTISANSQNFHAISNDGKLYGWGDNYMGSIGNGVEVDWRHATPAYQGDPAAVNQLMQTHPVQVTGKSNFLATYQQPLFGCTEFATDSNFLSISAGRDKGGVLGTGVVPCSGSAGNQEALYPNSWDRAYATYIDPTLLSFNTPTITPRWLDCPTCTYVMLCDTNTSVPAANAGANFSVTSGITTATLTGSGSTCTGGKLQRYFWSQLSGPSQVAFDLATSVNPGISGLSSGSYLFQLTVTDNYWRTSVSTVTVNVGGSPPTVNAGVNQVITLPTNTATFCGTAAGNNGATIASVRWVVVSGPGYSAGQQIGTANCVTLNGLTQGAYVLQFQATDSNGLTATSNVNLTVNAASGPTCTDCFISKKRRIYK